MGERELRILRGQFVGCSIISVCGEITKNRKKSSIGKSNSEPRAKATQRQVGAIQKWIIAMGRGSKRYRVMA